MQVGGSTVGQFLYDANGLRTYKTETLNSITSQKRYHYQNLNVIAESDEDGNPLFNYYHDGQTIIGREDAQAESSDLDKLQSYHQDALGSTALISKTDGSLNARYQYDAFGNVQNESGNSESNDYTYTGHERDQATGLIYAKARYYDPQLGLFLSRDPFEGYNNTPMSLHRYLYAYQNPNKYVDPDGRQAITTGNPYLAPVAVGEQVYHSSERVAEIVASEVTGVDYSNARENLFESAKNFIKDGVKAYLIFQVKTATFFVVEGTTTLGTTLEHDLPDMSPTGYQSNPDAGRAKTYQSPIVDVEAYIATTPLSDEFNQSWTTITDDRSGDYDSSPYLQERDDKGRFVSTNPELSPSERIKRSDVYPRDYRSSTKKKMEELYGDGQGNYINPETGEIIPAEEATFDHNPPIVQRWNESGYNQSRQERIEDYNDVDKLRPMCRSQNCSEGARNGQNMRQTTGPNFSN